MRFGRGSRGQPDAKVNLTCKGLGWSFFKVAAEEVVRRRREEEVRKKLNVGKGGEGRLTSMTPRYHALASIPPNTEYLYGIYGTTINYSLYK